jgi:hypothetical protein
LPRHQTRTLVVLFVALAIVAGCGRRRSTRSASVRQLKKSELSIAEQNYGIAPILDPSVIYQPDVIIVGGGADAIRAQSSNGFVWTIDGSAPHAAELVAGKIFFMTGRAVGRVLDVRKDAGNLVIVVGPVNLNEVIREAHIELDMPLDFGEAIAYSLPDLPGRVVSLARASTDGDAAIRPVAFVAESGSTGDSGAAPPGSDVSKLVKFRFAPFANSSGIGVEGGSDAGDLTLYARAALRFTAPKLTGKIDVTPAGTDTWVELSGGAGLSWKFAVGTKVGRSANVNGILEPAIDLSIPIGGPVPLSATIRHRLRIQTALGVTNSTLSATGDYTFKGSFKIGYVGKKWAVKGPTEFSATQSMVQTAAGVSLGASGVDLADQVKVIVGIGAAGFTAGPFFRLTSAVGLFKGSSLGMIECKEATIVVSLGGGLGYQIPKSVASIINSFLSALKIDYRINDEGGLSSESITIKKETSTLQGCKAGEGK